MDRNDMKINVAKATIYHAEKHVEKGQTFRITGLRVQLRNPKYNESIEGVIKGNILPLIGRQDGNKPLTLENLSFEIYIGGASADILEHSWLTFDIIAITGEQPQLGGPDSRHYAQATAFLNGVSRPETATKSIPFVNSLGMKFFPVPIDRGPSAGSTLLFSVWETRVQDFTAFARDNTVNLAWKSQTWNKAPVSRQPLEPVAGVSLDEAKRFCEWLTKKEVAEGQLSTAMAYRIPCDEEWSCAVQLPPEIGRTPWERKSQNSDAYPWGNGFPPDQALGNYADTSYNMKYGAYLRPAELTLNSADGFEEAAPVGSFAPNEFGIYDLGGNVWEWCTESVLRGASWKSYQRDTLLSAYRPATGPQTGRYSDGGFRCVLAFTALTATPSQPAAPPEVTIPDVSPAPGTPIYSTGRPSDKNKFQ